MIDYFEHFLTSKGNRDTVFEYVFGLLKNTPASILEIGVARDLSFDARRGDGWSSMHFGNYISKFGGELTLVDISPESLKNCRTLIDSIKPHILYKSGVEDGYSYLLRTKEKYDLILIDGSDDPVEMLDCFNLARKKSPYVLCDDFHTKGSILRKVHPEFTLFTWPNNPHQMALYGDGTKNLEMPIIE